MVLAPLRHPQNQLKGFQLPSAARATSAFPYAMQEVVTAEVDQREEQVHCVLCLGHNKGMEEAATSLAVGPPLSLPIVTIEGLPFRRVLTDAARHILAELTGW